MGGNRKFYKKNTMVFIRSTTVQTISKVHALTGKLIDNSKYQTNKKLNFESKTIRNNKCLT